MIRPPGMRAAAFGTAADGNGRDDSAVRRIISEELGIPLEWAAVRQVHGSDVMWAEGPGHLGSADALATTVPGVPLTVATADCVPVILEADGAAGIAHAGWRGVVAGVVASLRDAMTAAGHPPVRAAVGPGIGACCFEVGTEVVATLGAFTTTTTWGTTSVDLQAALAHQLEGLVVWSSSTCTRCDDSFHSFRRNGTEQRQVAVTWLPMD